MTLCNYWKVIPQFVPLTGLHADICVLQIGAVQAERIYISLYREKIKTSVTSAYIACATGKWYHSILPVLIFPIQILIERKLQTAGITAN